MQRPGLGVDPRLGRFEAGLSELIIQLRDVAGRFELLGGTLEFQRLLRHLIARGGCLILRFESVGLGSRRRARAG